MFILFLLLSCVLPQHIFSIRSGLYVDNGIDQTVIQRILSRKEKLQFEREMLNLLGLPRKPRRVSNFTVDTSASRFLLDIYKSLDKTKTQFISDEFNVAGEDILTIKESDSIITFLSHDRHVNNVRHERGKRIWFDLSDVHPRDIIMNAELRLYQEKRCVESSFTYTITLYEILLDYNGEKELEYVDAANTTVDNEGWLVFNVSGPVNNWVAMPSSNRGLYVSVHKLAKSYHEISPEDIGVMSMLVPSKEEKQPFLVAFIKSSNDQKVNLRRTTRDTRKKKSDDDVSYASNPFTPESAFSLRSCQIQTLYVNFKDLNWHEWIIAPDGYAAFYCSGLCDFPLNAHMNATNHAIVQTLVHLIDPFEVPKPYCAPTKLGPIAVLYYLEDSNVIFKKYKNMIVKSCGCH